MESIIELLLDFLTLDTRVIQGDLTKLKNQTLLRLLLMLLLIIASIYSLISFKEIGLRLILGFIIILSIIFSIRSLVLLKSINEAKSSKSS